MNRILDIITPRFITEDVYLVTDGNNIFDVWTKCDYDSLTDKSLAGNLAFTHKGVSRCFNLFGIGLFAKITNIEAI